MAKSFLFVFTGIVLLAYHAIAHASCPRTVHSEHFEYMQSEVNRILSFAGVADVMVRFTNHPEIKTAAAIMCDDQPYIYLNSEFFRYYVSDHIDEKYVLAHEIGHHLAGHLSDRQDSHHQELEADYFAGFILHKMKLAGEIREQGITRGSVTGLASALPESASDSHPGRYDRQFAVEDGWDTAKEQSSGYPRTKYYRRTDNCMSNDFFPEDGFEEHERRREQIVAIAFGPPDPAYDAATPYSENAGFRWCLIFYPYPEELVDETWFTGSEEHVKGLIMKKWKEGYDIDKFVYAQGSYVVIMEKYRPRRDYYQTYIIEDYFPREAIKAAWRKGYRVSEVSYGDGKWIVVLRIGSDENEHQVMDINITGPQATAFTDRYYNKGYEITSEIWAQGKWISVMTKPRHPLQTEAAHSTFSSNYFPKWQIMHNIRSPANGREFYPTVLSYDRGLWNVVMTARPD